MKKETAQGHETSVLQFTCCRCELIVVESRADDGVPGDYQCMEREHLLGAWKIFLRKPLQQLVTTGRFEIERNGEAAYLEYSLSANVLELTHTEVPEKLRGMGLASSLAETALSLTREKGLKVDIICPTVQEYVAKHPEYPDLVLH